MNPTPFPRYPLTLEPPPIQASKRLSAHLGGKPEYLIPEVIDCLTVTHENVDHPGLPPEAHDGVLRGMDLLRKGPGLPHRAQLFGSGADVWSVTSYVEPVREGREQGRLWREGTDANRGSHFAGVDPGNAVQPVASRDTSIES